LFPAGAGVFANVTYAGNAPGLVSGVTQVNFQMPSVYLVGPGPTYYAQIAVSVGAASTGSGPIIWYQ
jgi:uncharacterized protein (TIGR03437 family)